MIYKPDDNEKPKGKQSVMASAKTDIAAAVVSLIPGAYSTREYVKKLVSGKYTFSPYDSLMTETSDKYDAVFNRYWEGELSKEETRKITKEIGNEYNKGMHEIGELIGTPSFREQWKSIGTSEKLHAIAFGAGVSAVMLGTILTLAQRVADRHRDSHENDPSLSR